MLKRLVEFDPIAIPNTVVVSLTSLGVIGELLQNKGVKIHALNLSPLGLNLPIVIWRLIKLIRYHQPDIVQTWMYHADLLGGLAARLAGCKNVVWGIRSTAIPQGFLSVTFWLIRLCAICSHIIPYKIICCAQSAKAAHIKLGYAAHKITVISNGYDFSAFEQYSNSRAKARMELGFDDNEIVIGVVGRFDPLKDFHNFITAASILSAKLSNIKFLMIGRNIEWSNSTLYEWIEDGGLIKNFQLLGERSNIPFFLSAMDVFCLSSVNEAFPNVVVEAMAMELPCVVTQAGDAADIVGDNDFVVPVKDSVSLANALLRMYDLSPEERINLGKKGSKRVREKYDIKNIRQQYEKMWELKDD
ncbi:MAG: hypothetical protein RIQ94_618 [Pseudomonadota bacterium]|jgi:glycosyltransferase involved in cell wall biosynthesis